MCGIAGCLQPHVPPDQLAAGLNRMLSALSHRGPDDRGIWCAPSHGLGLGHRRLSIRDLSAAGHQPMLTEEQGWGLVYNGEIYNAEELRQQLRSPRPWRGHSDTEVLLRAIQDWGLARTLAQTAGMFAFAVWDRSARKITLVRDRLGIKPLYYSIQDGQVFWASELKALLAHPAFHAEIEPRALQLFLRFGYVPAPDCILRRTWKVMPGSWLEFDIQAPSTPRAHIYWDAAEIARHARRQPLPGSDNEIAAGTRELLTEIVSQHLVADVPLGAFLSGGIDSSLIVALAQAQSARRLKTYSIGFHEPRFDEAPHARRVAAALGTDHHEHYVSSDEVAELVPQWAEHYCEPFSDTSGLPSLIICREARRQVSVALTGDGGDELFAGYRRYQQTLALYDRVRRVPGALRRTLQQLLAVPPQAVYDRLDPLQRLLASRVREGLGESVRKTRSLLGATDQRALYECLASVSFDANATGVLNQEASEALNAASVVEIPGGWQSDWELLGNMQLWDSQIYLPNDILHKVDIASMAVGLEARVPLLDHRLYEWSWSVPEHLKFEHGQGKRLLRRLLGDYLPPELFERRKQGFSAPLDGWLLGPLRDWAESLLTPHSVEASGLLESSTVDAYWHDLKSGRAGHARIWPILVFLAWQRHYLQPRTASHEHHLCHSGGDSLPVGSQP